MWAQKTKLLIVLLVLSTGILTLLSLLGNLDEDTASAVMDLLIEQAGRAINARSLSRTRRWRPSAPTWR